MQITLNDAPVAAPAPAQVPRKVVRRQPAPAPVVVRQTAPAPKPQPRVVPAPVVVAAPTPTPTPAPAPAPQTRPAPRVASACEGASPLSRQYLRGAPGAPVRCGPQAEPIVAPSRVATVRQGDVSRAADDITITAKTRIVPKHVAQNRINTIDNVRAPRGYKQVWDDGRLNPHRAEQTLAGRSDMLLIWTQTVPRRLINQRTGRDVTASVPLVYPYLDIVTQRRELGEVTIVQRDGRLAKRIVRNSASARATTKRQPVYSSRSAPQAAQPQAAAASPALAGKRFVQIGTYGNPSNARRAAQNVARMGMAARIGKHSRGGKTYMTVQAGPFRSAGAVQSAMNRLRGLATATHSHADPALTGLYQWPVGGDPAGHFLCPKGVEPGGGMKPVGRHKARRQGQVEGHMQGAAAPGKVARQGGLQLAGMAGQGPAQGIGQQRKMPQRGMPQT